MQKKKRERRRIVQQQWVDLGPAERIARGEVIVTGEGRRRQGRVVDVITKFNEREQHAALHLMHLGEQARFDGYHASKLAWSAYSTMADDGPSAKACHARLQLYRLEKKIPPRLWSVIWYVLIAGETQALYAIRARIQRRHVRPMLQAGLSSAADLLHR